VRTLKAFADNTGVMQGTDGNSLTSKPECQKKGMLNYTL